MPSVPTAPENLVPGPARRPPGALRRPRIALRGGRCGAGGAPGQTQLVPDVHAFPGHIACDGRSLSEVVVPVFARDGTLIAVFDVDSDQPAAFDDTDARWLEQILASVFGG